MNIEVSTRIRAPREKVWKAVTDIENAVNTISAIEKIVVLERPSDGIVGLKWRETRKLFGKTAEETMWITDARDNESYTTRAESHGSVYTTIVSLGDAGGSTELSMRFGAEPVTPGAKIMWALTGFLFKGATAKALMQDLEDIKKAVERADSPGGESTA